MQDNNLDAQIKMYEKKIQALKSVKEEQDKKLKQVKKLEKQINELCKEHKVSLDDIFYAQSDSIEKWIKNLSKQTPDAKIITNLKKYLHKKPLSRSKKPADNKPKLAVGTYQNPNSKEKVEKIKRNPKTLENWIEEYGFDTVQSWKI